MSLLFTRQPRTLDAYTRRDTGATRDPRDARALAALEGGTAFQEEPTFAESEEFARALEALAEME